MECCIGLGALVGTVGCKYVNNNCLQLVEEELHTYRLTIISELFAKCYRYDNIKMEPLVLEWHIRHAMKNEFKQ